jgi:hypothetical protein
MRCFNRRKYQQENGPDVKLIRRNRQKINSCVWGKARQRATQAPPPRTTPGFSDFYMWRKRQIELPSAKSGRPIETPEWGGFRVS